MTSILIVGHYGRHNAGDEAILAGMVSGLCALRTDLDIVVTSSNPEETQGLHPVQAVAWRDIEGLIREVSRSSLVIVGGGGLFQDYWGVDETSFLSRRQGGISEYGGPILLANMLGKPSMFFGVGIGPLRTPQGRRITQQLFEMVDAATVRDESSLHVLEEIGCRIKGIQVTADPALCAKTTSVELPELGLEDLPKPLVGVALRHWSMETPQETLEKEITAALEAFLEESEGTVVFVPMQHGDTELEDDVTVSWRIWENIGDRTRARMAPLDLDPLQRFALLQRFDLVLGMRLHALIAAICGAVPCVGLSYDPKIDALLKEAGLSDYTLPLTGLTSEALKDLLTSAHRERDHLRALAEKAREKLSQRAGKSALLAVDLLGRDHRFTAPAPLVSSLALNHVQALAKVEEALTRSHEQLAKSHRNAETLSGQLELLQERLTRVELDLQDTRVSLSHAQAELTRIKSSRGWRVLWKVWRLVWRLKERSKPLAPTAGLVAILLHRMRTFIHAAALSPLPPWLRAVLVTARRSRNSGENAVVVLFTDRESLFPEYTPRRSLSELSQGDIRVSLVATIKDEAPTIEGWLRQIEGQTRQPDEIVLVDGGSTDGTLKILEAFKRRSALPVTVLQEPGANYARGRNLGIAHARGPLIATTDAGCTLDSSWLANLLSPFGIDPDIEVVAGWYEASADTALGKSARHELAPRLSEIHPATFIPSSRSFAFRKEAWKVSGGYPEWLTLTGEDTYFSLELKRRCRQWAFVPEAVVHWHAPTTLAAFWSKLRSWASGDGESGLFDANYRKGLVMLTLGSLALITTGAAAALLLGPGWALVPFLFVILVLLASNLVRRLASTEEESLHQPWWRLVGLTARSVGFLQGVRNRPTVALRRHAQVSEITLILSGVPMDDTGGGARAAQMAQELLKRDSLVVFLHQFPKQESVDLKLQMRHPHLLHIALENFDWPTFHWEYAKLLQDKPITALVEFPLRGFLPLTRSIRILGGTVVYDLIDNWETELGGRWFSHQVEAAVVESSHVLVASSRLLAERLERISAREPLLLPNAVDPGLFDRRLLYERPPDLPLGAPLLIYSGALWGSWFDWDLLLQIADSHPQASIVVIGDYQGQCPSRVPNLHFLGLKPQTALPGYLAHADVALIPWKDNAITQATSPIKVYEYIAMGLPVVAPKLEPLTDLPLILCADDGPDFVCKIEEARRLQVDDKMIDAFLKVNSWEARLTKLVEALDASRRDRFDPHLIAR